MGTHNRDVTPPPSLWQELYHPWELQPLDGDIVHTNAHTRLFSASQPPAPTTARSARAHWHSGTHEGACGYPISHGGEIPLPCPGDFNTASDKAPGALPLELSWPPPFRTLSWLCELQLVRFRIFAVPGCSPSSGSSRTSHCGSGCAFPPTCLCTHNPSLVPRSPGTSSSTSSWPWLRCHL